MPTLVINANVKLENPDAFIKKASKLVAQITAKPESYVLVVFKQEVPVSFGGNSTDPAAYVELSSIGFRNKNETMSESLSSFFQQELGVSPDRAYIKFTNLSGSELGWNGSTF